MNVIGLDIGTTTICGIAVDAKSGELLKSVTLDNDSFIEGKPFEKIQSPEKIIEKVTALAAELFRDFAPVCAIGITGQMHGIVYLDADGKAVSPLYTWQDGSGNENCGETTYAKKLSDITGYPAASGFGGTTYYYHNENNLVPEKAVGFCTIHDYAAMVLTARKTALVHTSDAASFGLFDLENGRFDKEKIEKAGLDYSFFPEVTDKFESVGEYNGVPVCCAIGDNQASFIGSVKDMDGCALVNMGTGGQISMLTDLKKAPAGMEIRPLGEGKMILVGCSLCGGRAFAALAEFFSSVYEMISGEKPKNIYRAMDAALANGKNEDSLKISTKLCGTRDDPTIRGSVENLGTDNFTPVQMMNGFLGGMVSEITDMIAPTGCEIKSLVGSGNGLRKNIPLQMRFSKALGCEMSIPLNREEAAFGAALTALVAGKIKPNLGTAQQLVRYESSIL